MAPFSFYHCLYLGILWRLLQTQQLAATNNKNQFFFLSVLSYEYICWYFSAVNIFANKTYSTLPTGERISAIWCAYFDDRVVSIYQLNENRKRNCSVCEMYSHGFLICVSNGWIRSMDQIKVIIARLFARNMYRGNRKLMVCVNYVEMLCLWFLNFHQFFQPRWKVCGFRFLAGKISGYFGRVYSPEFLDNDGEEMRDCGIIRLFRLLFSESTLCECLFPTSPRSLPFQRRNSNEEPSNTYIIQIYYEIMFYQNDVIFTCFSLLM